MLSGIPIDFQIYIENDETFDMARARNINLINAKYSYLLIIDLDVRLDKKLFDIIITNFNSVPNSGVLNIKQNYTSGNGNWFGKTEIFRKNMYCEKFTKFWYEDTEFLLNFSRIGIYPLFLEVPYIEKQHSREYTNLFINNNKDLFKKICLSSRVLA